MAKNHFTLLSAGIAAAMFAFAVTPSLSDSNPSFTYTGSIMQTDADVDGDGNPTTLITAKMFGSFGASLGSIASEFYADGGPCGGATEIHFAILHATTVMTFSNGDQLYGRVARDDGGYCFDFTTGAFAGDVTGEFFGGTGRFANATGTFSGPFSGYNLTGLTLGFGYGPISGDLAVTIDFD